MGSYDDHARTAEKAKDRFTAEYFGDLPKVRFLPTMDSPVSPEEPQTMLEWFEEMSEGEFYADFTEIAVLAEQGCCADRNQMTATTSRIKRLLTECIKAREESEEWYPIKLQAAACLIVDVMLNSARNYKEKRQ